MIATLLTRLNTARALGISNICHVLLYRTKLKYKRRSISKWSMPTGPFFKETVLQTLSFSATQDWQDQALYFGWWPRPLNHDNPPDWHLNPMTGVRAAIKPWWQLSDFSSEVGDIKLIWEASRMTWVIAFIERYLAGDQHELFRLNQWLEDWCVHNPYGFGANWKCGQEAGIRVMHLAMGAMLLRQTHEPTQGLLTLIRLHMQRIESTLRYAIAQDNNHATSEAAALYIGGSWLSAQGDEIGAKWFKMGKKWLEKRVGRLVMPDGSFSQYSVNYHRVLLDTLSMVELWRRHLLLQPFSERFQTRTISAVNWLMAMVDCKTGGAPNLGANDGAYLFPVATRDFRDFRASVQTAMILFKGISAYEEVGDWNARLLMLGIPIPKQKIEPLKSQVFDNGGYTILCHGRVMALLRYPNFQFRPSQADILHVDLWCEGENHLRDAGTYTYHASSEEQNYFSGTKGHNTIQFDDRDQMPRLGRFLFGDWLKVEKVEPLHVDQDEISFSASYRDRHRVYHRRTLILSEKKLTVVDRFEGFQHKAVLRWRLKDADWVLSDNQLVSSVGQLRIMATVPIIRQGLIKGMESRYYLQKKEIPVFEVEVYQSGELITEYTWTQ